MVACDTKQLPNQQILFFDNGMTGYVVPTHTGPSGLVCACLTVTFFNLL